MKISIETKIIKANKKVESGCEKMSVIDYSTLNTFESINKFSELKPIE